MNPKNSKVAAFALGVLAGAYLPSIMMHVVYWTIIAILVLGGHVF